MAPETVHPLCRQQYDGRELGLVIGIDVGTTFSGVSYAILRPDEVPVILPVTRFSSLGVSVSSIPSVIYYDEDLGIKAIGAATTLDTVVSDAEGCDWFKCEHFKLHLRPDNAGLDTNGLEIGKLPPGKSAEDVMADFLKYLLDETSDYIQTSHADGSEIWKKVKDGVVFILGHPNNWAGRPQERYRQAAISAGLVPDTLEGRKRIQFVTEGEASALACLAGGLSPSRLDVDFRFIVVDAGGGTIDISSYRVRKESPIELEECAPSNSMFAGSIFVNMNGHKLLQRMLRGSEFDDKDTLRDIIKDSFEMKTKREFIGDEDYALVQIGNRRLNNKKLGIRGGFLRLKTQDLSDCFSLSIRNALASIRQHLSAMPCNNGEVPVWLVGGFAASPYLLKKLSESLDVKNVTIRRPQTNTVKAVADGAVLYYLDQAVKARRAGTSFGTECHTLFLPFMEEHIEHLHLLVQDDRGIPLIGPIFSCILEKGTVVEASQTFKKTYMRDFLSMKDAKEFTKDIIVYDGNLPYPVWYLENEDKFRKLCTLRADLSEVCPKSTVDPNASMIERLRRRRWTACFDVEIKLGTTELEAVVKYEMNGEIKHGPVSILYD